MDKNSMKMLTEELAAAIWHVMDTQFLTGIEWSYLTPEEQDRFRGAAEEIWEKHRHHIIKDFKADADLEFVQEMVENFEISETDSFEQVVVDVSKSIWTIISRQNGQNRRFGILPFATQKTLLDTVRPSLGSIYNIFYGNQHNTEFFPQDGRPNPARRIPMQAPAPANSGLVKLSVNLNPETAKALKDLSYLQNKSITDTMRQAIAVLQYLDNERAQGRVIRTMDKNGKKVREITVSD